MKIGIDMGHSLPGQYGSGAVGLVRETDKNREIGNALISMLKEKGHTVVNCTVDKAVSVNNQLIGIVRKANAQTLDLFVSIHLNAGGGVGTESYIYSGKWAGKELNRAAAKKINDAVAASCGFTNRGVKEANLYVLQATVAPAVLLEVCFVDTASDIKKLNCSNVAKAIFKGITGVAYTPKVVAAPAKTTSTTGCEKVIKAPYTEVGGKGTATIIVKEGINFRDKYCTHCGKIQGAYNYKESVTYDKVCITEKYTWISWTGPNGARRWMPITDRKTGENWVSIK